MSSISARTIHGNVDIQLDDSRMLQLSRLGTSLPVFASEALRNCTTSSVRFLPGGWLLIVAGNELFVWKYTSTNQPQLHSSCLNFTLPPSDLPHNVLLVNLLFPLIATGDRLSPPTGCVALTPCGENLRVWNRISRNAVHTDINLTGVKGNGFYGDEAIQLEPTAVDELICRPLSNSSKSAFSKSSMHAYDDHMTTPTSGLLSGIGRRVSNLFGLVGTAASSATTGLGLGSHNQGGECNIFVRLITVNSKTLNNVSYIYMLLEKRLDIWTLDSTLEEQSHSIHQLDSLCSLALPNSPHGFWSAVDMAVHSSSSTADSTTLYLLVEDMSQETYAGRAYHLLTLSIEYSRNNHQLSYTINPHGHCLIQDLFPSIDSQVDNTINQRKIKLCLPNNAITSPAVGSPPIYPCLLACMYRAGFVVITEVLTGQTVAKIKFGHSSSLPSSPFSSQPSSILIGCGGVDVHNLFVFVTNQHGLLALTPVTGFTAAVTDNQQHDSSKLRSSNLSIDSAHSECISRHPYIPERVPPTVRVLTRNSQTLLELSVQLSTSSDGLMLYDIQNPQAPLCKSSLDPADKLFVVLSELVRIYWMGFHEQAVNYLHSLMPSITSSAKKPHLLASSFLRLTKRLLNERPLADPRWRSIQARSAIDSSQREAVLCQEGCYPFQYVTFSGSNESPLLNLQRLNTKRECVERLKEVLSKFTNHVTELNGWLNLTEVPQHLGIHLCFPACTDVSEIGETEPHRYYAGEKDMSKQNDSFKCTLADDGNEVESCAERLLCSLDVDRLLQASADQAMSSSGSAAVVHLLSGLHLAEELVEFTKAIQNKLSQESNPLIRPIFQRVASQAGFSAAALHTLNAQDAVLQTVTLIPMFIIELGTSMDSQFGTTASATGDHELDGSAFVPITTVQFFMNSVELLTTGISAVCTFRTRTLPNLEQQINDVTSVSHETHYLPCWLTDTRPFGVGDVLLSMFDRLVKLGCGDIPLFSDNKLSSDGTAPVVDSSTIPRDATVKAIDWANYLLSIAHQRVLWATKTSAWVWLPRESGTDDGTELTNRVEAIQRLRRMRRWFYNLRKILINAIADRLCRPESALSLAERFADCGQMVRLCYLLERQDEIDQPDVVRNAPQSFHHQRLLPLLRRLPSSYGLADQALQWYFDSAEHARVQSLLTLLDESNADAKLQYPKLDSGQSVFTTQSVAPQPALTKSTTIESQQHFNSPLPSTGPSTVVNPVHRFLNRADARDLAWPHLLSTKSYSKACHILFEEGLKEQRFLGRRKTLLSLAKLSHMASDSHASTPMSYRSTLIDDQFIHTIDLLLEWCELQENLPRHLQQLQFGGESDWRQQTVLKIDSLTRLYVSQVWPAPLSNSTEKSVTKSHAFVCDIDEFCSAFRLADVLFELSNQCGEQLQLGDDAWQMREDLHLHIWCQAVKQNDWSNTPSHEDPIQICSRSFLCKLVRELGRTYENSLELLFTPERLLVRPELQFLTADPRFCYLIQSGHEFLCEIFN